MKIIEVNSKKTIQQFHQLPFQIYKKIKLDPHIQQEVEAVFTPKQNKFSDMVKLSDGCFKIQMEK